MYKYYLIALTLFTSASLAAQDMMPLITSLKAKMDQVNDYTAEGKMKTDVAFIKAPIGKVKVFYKKPNRFRLKKDGGISLLPKGGISVNMNALIATDSFVALGAGEMMLGGVNTKVVKLLPLQEQSDIVLSTLYIDEANLLIKKAVTTTKDNGTYEMEMFYGKYIMYGLPDKIIFSFNTKNYKLPQGLTMEVEDSDKLLTDAQKLRNKKGRVEITYSSYVINKGVADTDFK